MAHPRHRGPHPDDRRLFGPEALPRLRAASEEVAWLLGRDYSPETAIAAVGAHHQLELRQRVALRRSLCSEADRVARLGRALAPAQVRGAELLLDAFNVIIALEVALSGGLLLEGADGALRDLAGLRGSYHLVEETGAALALLAETLAALAPASARWYLDAPVSNSGRLRERLRSCMHAMPFPVEVELVANADTVLAGRAFVATADAALLEACPSWVNLARWIVEARVPGAWVVRLAPADGAAGS